MATILSIETATPVCSVALSQNETLINSKLDQSAATHAKNIGPFVEEMIKTAKEKQITIDAIALSAGPGSYTGLRIGTSIAKGLCFGLSIPLIAIPTLSILAYPLAKKYSDNQNLLLCPMLDARRMEVYTALFSTKMNELISSTPQIIDEHFLQEELETHQILFFGDGAAKCKPLITHPNASFIDDQVPLAQYMSILAEEKFRNKDFEDTAYFEPFYLKEFQATVAKNPLLAGLKK